MKNLTKLLGIIALVAVIGFGVAGCESPNDEPTHVHDYEWSVTTPATCIATGEETGVCKLDPSHTATREIAIDLVNGHDWNANVEIITTNAAATETENSIRAVKCKRDSTHLKDEVIEYATGTAGLDFALTNLGNGTNNAYRVSKGDFDGAALVIPAYHRPDADSPYLPVTAISNGINTEQANAFGGTWYNGITTENTTLTSVTFTKDSQLKIIGNYAFAYCTGLTGITIPDSETALWSDAFKGCTNLASITLPASVASIADRAFYECTSLTSVIIPTGVPSIGDEAFYKCTGLTSVTIPASVMSIGIRAFSYTGLTSVTIPDSVTYIKFGAFDRCTGLTSITIGSGVTAIDIEMFYGCSSLTNVIIPASVTSIGGNAFHMCRGLTEITIPASVTTMQAQVFYGWTNTQTINVPFANAGATPAGWDTNWKGNENYAVIKYWNGSSYQ